MSIQDLKTLIDQLEQGYSHLVDSGQRIKANQANNFIGGLIDVYMDREGVELPNCLK